jgi:hypothetical protein
MQQETLNQNEKQNQRQTVKEIVTSSAEPLRTDQIRLIAFKQSISCADTYLRMLARDGEISRFWETKPGKKPGTKQRSNKTKFWCSVNYFEQNVKPNMQKYEF